MNDTVLFVKRGLIHTVYNQLNIVSWELERHYHYSTLFNWEPEGCYGCTCTVYSQLNSVNWELERRYHYSMLFNWEPEGCYSCIKSMALMPFWFSAEDMRMSVTLLCRYLRMSITHVCIITLYISLHYISLRWPRKCQKESIFWSESIRNE